MRSSRLCAVLVGMLALIVAPFVKAEEPLFTKGTFGLYTYGQYAQDFLGRDQKLVNATTGLSYFPISQFSLNMEVSGYHVDQRGTDAIAGAFGVGLRHHIFVKDPFSIFLDGNFAIIEADHNTPPGGTHQNFTTTFGFGSTYRIKDNINLIGGIRYFHLSNARSAGPNRNPSINGTSYYLGVMFTF